MQYQAILEDIYAEALPLPGQGHVADYIPALAKIDPGKLGTAMKTINTVAVEQVF